MNFHYLFYPNQGKRRDGDGDDELKIESSSISTSKTKFNSLPEYPSSVHTHWKDAKEEGMDIEEVGEEEEELSLIHI